jgi:hypothetical protein
MQFFCVYVKTRKKLDKYIKVNKIRNKYIVDIEPGINFSVTARTQGGESVNTFLRINKNLFWPDI